MPPSCNNLEELDLLAVVIATARSLKALNIGIHLGDLGDDSIFEYLEMGTEPPFATAIQSQKDSLESLSIDSDHLAEISHGFTYSFNIHNALQDFPKLKDLTCPLGSLASIEADATATSIPPSLETLHIIIRADWQPRGVAMRTRSDWNFVPLLEEAVESHEVPNLNAIGITVDNANQGIEYDWSRLTESSSRRGIDLVVNYVPGSEWSHGWRDLSKVDSSDTTTSSDDSDEVSLYST